MPEPVREVAGKVAPLEADDVDTDQIIPAQFLKMIERKGLGRYLFYRWRHDEQGKAVPGFVLDREEFRGAKILVTGRNFGIGSSRENAVWALMDAGISCVIAASFGDIFYNNASKNSLLCVKLAEQTVRRLSEEAKSGSLTLTVDLENQAVKYGGGKIAFEIEPHVKERLRRGLDDIEMTLSMYEEEIKEYEKRVPTFLMPKARSLLWE